MSRRMYHVHRLSAHHHHHHHHHHTVWALVLVLALCAWLPPPCAAASLDKQGAAFAQWAQDAHGVHVAPQLSVRTSARHGRGLWFTGDVAKDSVVLRLPRSFWLTKGTALASPVAPVCRRWEALCLPALLLHVRHGRSRVAQAWGPVVAHAVPSAFDTVYFYNELELRVLARTSVYGMAVERIRDARSAWQQWTSEWDTLAAESAAMAEAAGAGAGEWSMFGDHRVTLEDYLWARSAAETRAFGLPVSGVDADADDTYVPQRPGEAHLAGKVIAYVGLACFFNKGHPNGNEVNVHWSLVGNAADAGDAGEVVMEWRTTRDVAAGEQALTSYGWGRPNSILLLDYGFMLRRGTDWDAISVDVDTSHLAVQPEGTMARWKHDMLQQLGPNPPASFNATRPSDRLITVARIMTYDGEDLVSDAKLRQKLLNGEAVDHVNEVKAYEYLVSLLTSIYKTLPTAEWDMEMEQKDPTSTKLRTALDLVWRERRMFEHAITGLVKKVKVATALLERIGLKRDEL